MSSCENCRFWDNSISQSDNEASGLCRRAAPRTNKVTGRALWPFTDDVDWCGKWRAREDGATPFLKES